MGQGAIRKLLTRKIYVGWRRFGKPEAEVVEMAVPPIIDAAELEVVQALLEIRARRSRPRASSAAQPFSATSAFFAPFAALP
jgi:hypothetical protein